MHCHGCQTRLRDKNFLKCNSCKSEYCFECLNLTSESCKELTRDQIKSISCPYCQNVTRRQNNDDTPCRQRSQIQSLNESMNISFGDVSQATNEKITNIVPIDSSRVKEPVSMESISKLFDIKLAPDSSFMMNLRATINKDVEKMVTMHVSRAVETLKCEFTSTTDFLAADQQDLRAMIIEKDNTIKQIKSDLLNSQNSIIKLQSRLSTIEKVSRDLNLEIHEVPETKNENLTLMFKTLCDCLKVVIPDGDVRACRRVAKMDSTSKRPRNILVTLSSPRLRDLVLSSVTRFNKAHPKDKLASTHIGLTGESRRIYLNEHLSPEVKEIHSAARKFCKEKNYKFVWIRFGQIYIRKDEQSPAVRVKSIDFLTNLRN